MFFGIAHGTCHNRPRSVSVSILCRFWWLLGSLFVSNILVFAKKWKPQNLAPVPCLLRFIMFFSSVKYMFVGSFFIGFSCFSWTPLGSRFSRVPVPVYYKRVVFGTPPRIPKRPHAISGPTFETRKCENPAIFFEVFVFRKFIFFYFFLSASIAVQPNPAYHVGVQVGKELDTMARHDNKLTVTQIRNIKKPGRYNDGGGL